MGRVKLRCDDIMDGQDAEKCGKLWKTAHGLGYEQLLAVTAGNLENNKKLINEVTKAVWNGDKLGLHGYTHIYYSGKPFEDQRRLMRLGVNHLRELIGTRATHFIPPYNSWDVNTRDAARMEGLLLECSNKHLGSSDIGGVEYLVYHPQWVDVSGFKKMLEKL